VKKIIHDYAREPGLRSLEKELATLCRKAATHLVEKKRSKKSFQIDVEKLDELLGPPRFVQEKADKIENPGVVMGLAWTRTGGDVLFIESIVVPGSSEYKLTGQLGDVMKESASIAYSYVRQMALREGLRDEKWFKDHEFHIHIPAGAIPKDGPSAGVTMATALMSLVRDKKSRQRLAMTGELSLVGKVLPVGGIKEKVLAAKRAGVKKVILPKENEKDLKEVPESHLKGLEFLFLERVDEVFDEALLQ
jgi:ATP-dependent Lon protease